MRAAQRCQRRNAFLSRPSSPKETHTQAQRWHSSCADSQETAGPHARPVSPPRPFGARLGVTHKKNVLSRCGSGTAKSWLVVLLRLRPRGQLKGYVRMVALHLLRLLSCPHPLQLRLVHSARRPRPPAVGRTRTMQRRTPHPPQHRAERRHRTQDVHFLWQLVRGIPPRVPPPRALLHAPAPDRPPRGAPNPLFSPPARSAAPRVPLGARGAPVRAPPPRSSHSCKSQRSPAARLPAARGGTRRGGREPPRWPPVTLCARARATRRAEATKFCAPGHPTRRGRGAGGRRRRPRGKRGGREESAKQSRAEQSRAEQSRAEQSTVARPRRSAARRGVTRAGSSGDRGGKRGGREESAKHSTAQHRGAAWRGVIRDEARRGRRRRGSPLTALCRWLRPLLRNLHRVTTPATLHVLLAHLDDCHLVGVLPQRLAVRCRVRRRAVLVGGVRGHARLSVSLQHRVHGHGDS